MTTKELEKRIDYALKKQGTYLCFEVMMPCRYRGTYNNERVDLLSYDTKGDWRMYELKVSKSDFHSKCKASFLGNLNYYVMPKELYEQVKSEIPHDIGCYVSDKTCCYCIKKAKRKELQVNEKDLMFQFMQSLYREYRKYLKIKHNVDENEATQ